MYIIVVGCGKIGYHLTRALLSAQHEVVVIEHNSRLADARTEEFGNIVVASDGTEPTVLSEAGAQRCDLLISTTGSDATNLMACQVAKYSYHVPRTIAVVTDPDHVPLFTTLGIDVRISTTDLILSHIEEEVSGGPLVHVLPLQGAGSGIVCVRVPADSPTVGKVVGELAIPEGATLAAVISKHGQLRAARVDVRIEAEDQVVAVTPPEAEDQLWRTLTGGR